MKRNKRFTVTTFILEMIFFWVIWFIRDYTWVNGADIISDLFNIVSMVLMVIIIVSAIFTIIQLKHSFSKDKSISVVKKIILSMIFIATISIHLFMYSSFVGAENSVSGVFNIKSKQAVED